MNNKIKDRLVIKKMLDDVRNALIEEKEKSRDFIGKRYNGITKQKI